ncbi:MAG: hypothetical protein ACK4GC_14460, partial [Paracoccaceae bacterium]
HGSLALLTSPYQMQIARQNYGMTVEGGGGPAAQETIGLTSEDCHQMRDRTAPWIAAPTAALHPSATIRFVFLAIADQILR